MCANNICVTVDKGEAAPVTSHPSSPSSCPPLGPTPSTAPTYTPDGAMVVAEGVTCYNKENHFRSGQIK